MKPMNVIKKFGSKICNKAAGFGAGLALLGSQAHAAVDAATTDLLTQAAIDVAAVAALAFAVYLAPKVFKYMRGGV